MSEQGKFSNATVLRQDILVDPSLNSRKTFDENKVNKLRDSIKAQGLIHPPLLIRTAQLGKRYEDARCPYALVAGFRRQMALDMMAEDQGVKPDAQECDYRIAPAAWNIEDAIMANLTENLSREDLSTYELASQCLELRDRFKLTGKDVAQRVKAYDSEEGSRKPLSEAHINNLIRCATSLHPEIVDAWKDQHPKASLRTLIALAAEKDQDAQLRQWKGVDEPENDDSTEEGGNGSGESTSATERRMRRPGPAQIAIMSEKVKDAAKTGAKSAEWAKGVIAALRWAGGLSVGIPGIKIDEE